MSERKIFLSVVDAFYPDIEIDEYHGIAYGGEKQHPQHIVAAAHCAEQQGGEESVGEQPEP